MSSDAGDRTEPWKRPATVSFQVREVIKGSHATQTLVLDGDAEHYDGPGDQDNFGRPRPGAERGGCNADDRTRSSKA